MAQTPASPVARTPSSTRDAILMPPTPPTPAPAVADERLRRPVRMCVLCGQALRAGQHMTRVQGSTVHARCCSIAR